LTDWWLGNEHLSGRNGIVTGNEFDNVHFYYTIPEKPAVRESSLWLTNCHFLKRRRWESEWERPDGTV
jgi:hypothetical protein